MHDTTVIAFSESFRTKLKLIEQEARDFIKFIKESQEELFDKGECIEDATLAMRHIEDARMRYGKVIQYATTWESNFTNTIFDKKVVNTNTIKTTWDEQVSFTNN